MRSNRMIRIKFDLNFTPITAFPYCSLYYQESDNILKKNKKTLQKTGGFAVSKIVV